MPGFESVLAAMGAVPAGTRPKVSIDGGEPIYAQTDPLSNLARSVIPFMQEQQERIEKQQKKIKNRIDMYKTLREAGYDPKRAFSAVQKDELPDTEGDETLKEQRTKADINLLNERAEVEKNKILTPTRTSLETKILSKVQNGEALTPGEQKVYDDVIRKYGQKADLETILSDKKEDVSADASVYVKMLDPSGKPKKVHKDDVKKALAKGWKKR